MQHAHTCYVDEEDNVICGWWVCWLLVVSVVSIVCVCMCVLCVLVCGLFGLCVLCVVSSGIAPAARSASGTRSNKEGGGENSTTPPDATLVSAS